MSLWTKQAARKIARSGRKAQQKARRDEQRTYFKINNAQAVRIIRPANTP